MKSILLTFVMVFGFQAHASITLLTRDGFTVEFAKSSSDPYTFEVSDDVPNSKDQWATVNGALWNLMGQSLVDGTNAILGLKEQVRIASEDAAKRTAPIQTEVARLKKQLERPDLTVDQVSHLQQQIALREAQIRKINDSFDAIKKKAQDDENVIRDTHQSRLLGHEKLLDRVMSATNTVYVQGKDQLDEIMPLLGLRKTMMTMHSFHPNRLRALCRVIQPNSRVKEIRVPIYGIHSPDLRLKCRDIDFNTRSHSVSTENFVVENVSDARTVGFERFYFEVGTLGPRFLQYDSRGSHQGLNFIQSIRRIPANGDIVEVKVEEFPRLDIPASVFGY